MQASAAVGADLLRVAHFDGFALDLSSFFSPFTCFKWAIYVLA
jgi:hypothetical protein